MKEQILATTSYSLREAGEKIGLSYWPMYRAVIEGRLKPIAGLRATRISDAELQRFLTTTRNRLPKKFVRRMRSEKAVAE